MSGHGGAETPIPYQVGIWKGRESIHLCRPMCLHGRVSAIRTYLPFLPCAYREVCSLWPLHVPFQGLLALAFQWTYMEAHDCVFSSFYTDPWKGRGLTEQDHATASSLVCVGHLYVQFVGSTLHSSPFVLGSLCPTSRNTSVPVINKTRQPTTPTTIPADGGQQ